MRVVFFGTPAFAVPTLARLLESSHRVVASVTQSDRPSGRGQRTHEPPVKQVARERGIPVLQPDRLKDPSALDALRAFAPDLGVVAAYGRILPDDLLHLPRLGMINVHASLLPKYRGAAPVHRAVMAGETETGVSIMRVIARLDAGPVLATARRAIGPDETSDEVERDLARLGATLLVETVDALAAGRARETPQDERLATYAPRLTKQDGLIDWHAPARAIHNQVRGLHPWPHAYTSLGGRRYVILRTAIADTSGGSAAPGRVVEARGDRLVVAAGDGAALAVVEIQPQDRRAMTAREFLAGHPVPVGAAFGPPSDTGR